MPVTLTIIADNAVELVQEFRLLNRETTTPADGPVTTLDQEPLDALIERVRQRLREDGFKLEIIDERSAPETPPLPDANAETPVDKFPESPSPELPAPKAKKGKKVPAETITEPSTVLDDDPTTPRKTSKAPSKPLIPLDEPEPEADPAGDRQHVLDTLAGILKDPKQKDKVLTFASGMAKKHGKDKISELPVDPFPEIRRAMEKEFSHA